MPTAFLKITAAALAAVAPLARAHDGHDHSGLLAGLAHPIGGVDHLLATLGIGLVAGIAVAARSGSRVPATGPAPGLGQPAAALALGLVLGAVAALLTALGAPQAVGGFAPGVEGAVALGLLALAVAVVGAERIGTVGMGLLAAAVAVPHGWLHATEGGGSAAFMIGLALTSAGLFAGGTRLGHALTLRASPRAATAWRRLAAAGYAGTGVMLLVAGLR
jgi:urease accessory protein